MLRIPGDLQQVVFNVAAQSHEHWTSLLSMYSQTTYDAEKRKMLLGLASTQDVRSIAWYVLQFLLSTRSKMKHEWLCVTSD